MTSHALLKSAGEGRAWRLHFQMAKGRWVPAFAGMTMDGFRVTSGTNSLWLPATGYRQITRNHFQRARQGAAPVFHQRAPCFRHGHADLIVVQ